MQQLYIRTITGKNLVLKNVTDQSISDILPQIIKYFDIDTTKTKIGFAYKGKLLDQDLKLSTLGITHDITLNMILGPLIDFRAAIAKHGRHNICPKAAEHGNLGLLMVARENSCPWDARTCTSAAEGGHLEVLQWARANGCPWDEATCSGAAYSGHLEMLQWARYNGCPWDEFACSCAAIGGHLEVLKWLRANGCPWDEDTCSSAADGGHQEVLQWARANGCPYDDEY